MTQNELFILDDIIINKLNSSNFSGADSIETIIELTETIRISVEQNKTQLITEAFDIKNREPIESIINRYQKRFILLSNTLFTRISIEKRFTKNFKIIEKHIDELLTFIQTYFSEYLNKNLVVPLKVRENTLLELNNFINTKINNLNALQSELLVIALAPINILNTNPDKTLTYIDIDYLNNHLSLIHETLINSDSLNFEDTLTEKLIENNFNCWRFINYMSNKIKESATLEYSLSNQMLKYHWHKKNLKQTLCDSSKIYIENLEPVNDVLLRFIDSELHYLEMEAKRRTISEVQLNNEKICLNMSVPFISTFFGFLWKHKMIECENLKVLSNQISNKFKTTNTENISTASLYNHYYKPTHATKDELKGLFFKMLNEVNKS